MLPERLNPFRQRFIDFNIRLINQSLEGDENGK